MNSILAFCCEKGLCDTGEKLIAAQDSLCVADVEAACKHRQI